MINRKVSIIVVSMSLLLAGCGGDDDSDSPDDNPSDPKALTGHLADTMVAGVSYTTPTMKGVTDNQGRFEYQAGEMVTFALGETRLGALEGKEQISLFDLAGSDVLVGQRLRKAIHDNSSDNQAIRKVINTAVLLQTLDDDNDPLNGVNITTSVANLFNDVNINIDAPWQTFSDNSAFQALLNKAKTGELLGTSRQIRKAWLALHHVYETLNVDSGVYVAARRSKILMAMAQLTTLLLILMTKLAIQPAVKLTVMLMA